MIRLNVTRDELSSIVDRWSTKKFGPEFKYRPGQKDMIVDIIMSWSDGTKTAILDAPTGSGKSYIAMSIAGVLSEHFHKKGYILISDLSLIDQYTKDIERYFPKWGIIKGQDNYNCLENGMGFKTGSCRLDGYHSYNEIKMYYTECSKYCPYIVQRDKAISSDVTLCTYSFWLIHRNMDPKNQRSPMDFEERDFVICDEAHKATDIVQSHFSPVICESDETKFFQLTDVLCDGDLISAYNEDFHDFRNTIESTNDIKDLDDAIRGYANLLARLSSKTTSYVGTLKNSKKKKTSKKEYTVLNAMYWLNDIACRFMDYINLINNRGPNVIVKNVGEKGRIILNCLDESFLMTSRFIGRSGNLLFMSATIGDPAAFAHYTSTENDYVAYKLPNLFDYSNSPIFYVDEYKLTYNNKDYAFANIADMAKGIIHMYPNDRGIIQTGNYAFALQFYESLSASDKKRCLVYSNSKEKQDALDTYKYSNNCILIGPSLIEGLSLDDDLCRFQIILKIPYPSLADALVSAKMHADAQWYSNRTSISLLQGVGRGVRNKTDWCVTFILDGCFSTLLRNSYSMYPEEFINRINLIRSQTLICNQ